MGKLTLNTLPGARITVLGAARSGVEAALLLKQAGADVFLSEMAPETQKPGIAARLRSADIEYEFGGHTERTLETNAWVISPGIPADHPMVRDAQAKGIEVLGELEVASWFCKGRIAAVTGSNGKTTTTSMLGEMVKASGMQTLVAGNIGTAFSSGVLKLDQGGIAVVEVSNFQLETVRDFHPSVAVFLNLTPDHLDRHGSLENYGRIKARIFKNQTADDFAVIPADPTVAALADDMPGRKLIFGKEDSNLDCAWIGNGWLTVRWEGETIRLLQTEKMGVPGPHNALNGLAAAMGALSLGIGPDPVRESLARFRGLEHRLEFIRENSGVRWYNDSKATNVDSMQCALRSFKAPVVLIAGGRDKNSDFRTLTADIGTGTRSVILIGEAASKMQAAWQGHTRLVIADSLADAVTKAAAEAETGDVVLLSPGCASFDMFENYEDRGLQFKDLVNGL